ncbi:MAG: hypothetical protein FJ279_14605 [Planctomycetes bacterium]|nr:hypothetical protein [Planctomycetota bacterium]
MESKDGAGRFGVEESGPRLLLRLFMASFAGLFWQVLLIRWLPAELPFLGYFRSLVILASFLGLGLGCIVCGRVRVRCDRLVILFLLGIGIVVWTVYWGGDGLRGRGFGPASGILEQGSASVPAAPDFTLEFMGSGGQGNLVVAGAFTLVALCFVPLGVIIGQCFDRLPAIPAYLVNIGGSLLGTLAFVGVSMAGWTPPVWYFIGLISCWLLMPWSWQSNRSRLSLGTALALSLAVLATVHRLSSRPNIIWSPYQRITWYMQRSVVEDMHGRRTEVTVRGSVFVNHEYHQQIVNMAMWPDEQGMLELFREMDVAHALPPYQSLERAKKSYDLPYQRCKPKSVLIIASGVGNEAAAALRHGIEEIDAVEIDPGLVAVGRKHHPEQPYNSRVRVICDDARAFLERTKKRYDLIVMNSVDSHSQFASSAGLRLDSYIFTLEFFEQVRKHLRDDGLFATEFSGFHWNRVPWARARLKETLWRVFGYDALKGDKAWGMGGPIFLIRPADRPSPTTYSNEVSLSTDDWPQFYLRGRFIPWAYGELIVSVVLISALALVLARPSGLLRVDAHFFLLGSAFMLLEIKSITELSLAFGATWFVNAMVIAAILFAVGVANVIVLKVGRVPYAIGYAIVFLSLALGLVFTTGDFLALPFAARGAVACARAALPILGAGLVFATSFRNAALPPAALGWNLLGAMVGGLGEYLSLVTGVAALGWVIIILYALSLAALRFSHLRR